MSLDEAMAAKGQTDWAKVDADPLTEAEDAFDWAKAVVVERPRKASLTIRLDEDVLAYFRGTGAGYQTRINAVLRAWVKAQG
ncbi:MAG: BrnA antitoxin family protein [Betaproteobacteria bacterium]